MTEQTEVVIDVGLIPTELKASEQWVVWRKEQANPNEKAKKVPYDPGTGLRASTNDPTTWGGFDAACRAFEKSNYDGIGFVFRKNNPYCGVDLDNCRNPETGDIESWAETIVTEIRSYTEISPSGMGLHIIAKAKLPGGGRRTNHIEIYDQARYFTFTGNHLEGTPLDIHDRICEIEALYGQFFGSAKSAKKQLATPSKSVLSDEGVLQRARYATNGDKFGCLYSGDCSEYGSQSQADLALCSLLAHHCGGNFEQIDRLFRQSGLFREKWDQKHFSDGRTYGEATIQKALQNSNGSPMGNTSNITPYERPFPELDPAAFYGLAGDIVRTLEPHTEASPVGLLIQFQSEFSCVIGGGPRVKLDGASAPLLFYPVLVGQTSKARKGTADKRIRPIFGQAIYGWARGQGNLSSGEGLIYAVRDATDDDPGVSDKRLFLVQAEFGGTLKIMAREGNSLSSVIRNAWDGEDLSPMTKNSPIKATRPHIVIVGHITKEELTKHLNSTEASNGFGNRFAWFVVRRSKTLPFHSDPQESELLPLRRRLQEAVAFGKMSRTLKMTDKAREAWATVYPVLSEGRPGIVGAMLGRAEAQVMRLAGLYALLDKSHCIKRVHLEAALALWQYAEDSIEYIFGNVSGDWIADRILNEIRRCGKLTDSEISALFKRNVSAVRLENAKQLLQDRDLIEFEMVNSSGRPVCVWTLKTRAAR